MQEPEEKKSVGKHAPAEAAPSAAEEDVLRADADLYGDEAEVTIRPRRKKKAVSSKKKKKSKKKNKKKSAKRQFSLDALLTPVTSDRPFRKHRSLFETMSSSDSTVFRPISVFGHEVRFWPLILVAVVVVMIGIVFMNNSNVRVRQETVTIVGLPDDLENYRILVISDLNGKRFGDKQSALLRSLNNLSYNAVFILGDMVGEDGDPEPFYELLDGLPSSKKVFFIAGDSDPGPLLDTPREVTDTLSGMVLEDWVLGAIERGATYVDAPVRLTVGDTDLWITPATLMNYNIGDLVNTWEDQTEQEESGVLSGLDADYRTLPLTTYRYRVSQKLYDALDSMDDDDFYLALAHQAPSDDYIYAAASHNADEGKYLSEPELILAGHYCGGVIRLPLLGAVYVPDNTLPRNGWFPNQSKVRGLSTVGETQVYITGGLSTNSDTPLMFFRLSNQPEISLLTLSATLPESMLSAE